MINDQSEDEISAINKALGASFAGARALVATADGGFCLMVEGLSLCGMAEIPLVIIIGQRPGPATGLPTRMEQGALNLVLHAGTGYFPRVIFAPSSLQNCFEIAQNAFNLAAKYQIPVFILTDQYLVDSFYNIPSLDTSGLKIEKHIIKTEADYQRYLFTDNGISPRGIPGYGKGLVGADGHTHTESVDITEEPDIRTRQVQRQLLKYEEIKADIRPPDFVGMPNYSILIIAWGSTFHIIEEASRF